MGAVTIFQGTYHERNDFYGPTPCDVCNIFDLSFADFSGSHIGMCSFVGCAAEGFCTGNGFDRRELNSSDRVLRAATSNHLCQYTRCHHCFSYSDGFIWDGSY